MPRGLFLTFEGGEGAGKTTLIEGLTKRLQASEKPFLRTREPGGSVLGEEVRQLLLAHKADVAITPLAELCLFLAARAQHIDEVIEPALRKGVTVLCDRFNDSTIAYQGAGRGLGEPYVEQLCHLICGKTLPDLTFYLDIDPKVGLQRSRRVTKQEKGAHDSDRIEKEALEFHEKVRQSFLRQQKKDPQRMHVIDALQSPDKVLGQVWGKIEKIINNNNKL